MPGQGTALIKAAAALLVAALIVAPLQAAEPPAFKPYPLAGSSLILDVAATDQGLVAVGDRGFILKSTDGAQWAQVPSPAAVMLTSIAMTGGGQGWAVGHDTLLMRTTDGGATWSIVSSDPELETPLFDIWFENPQHGIAVGAFGIIKETTDGGANWNERRINEDEPHLYAIAAGAKGALYVAGEGGLLFRSADKGATWQPLESPYEGSFFGLLSLNDGGLLAFGLRGNLFRSDDGGNTWAETATGTEASLMGGVQRKDGRVVIVGLSGTVLTSADGRAFTLTSLPDREALSGAAETAAGAVLIYGEKGVHPLPEARP